MDFEGLQTVNEKIDINTKNKSYINIKDCDSILELNKYWVNYLGLPIEEQEKLNKEYIEINNISLREEYENKYNDITSRVYINPINESTDINGDYVKNINENKINNLNDLPFLTPMMMNEYKDYYSKSKKNDWNEAYQLFSIGVVQENYNELNIKRIDRLNELYKDYPFNNDEIKQEVLDLGWNPEITFSVSNRIKATKNTKMRLSKELNINNLYDATLLESSVITETKVKDRNPVHVVLVYTASPFGKAIKTYTKGIYTHASMSIDNTFDRLYSFNLSNNFNKFGGFSIESMEGYKNDNKDALICVYTTFVSDKQYKKLKKQITHFENNIDKTKYSILNVFSLLLNKPVELANDMICSQFVTRMFDSVGVEISDKVSSLTTPNDIYNSTKNKMFKTFEGKIGDFDIKDINRRISKLQVSALISEQESPVNFDNEGNLIISKVKDVEREYNKSHKLLLAYEKTNNYNAMKEELFKLWALNNKLEHMIYRRRKNNKEYHDMRARVLNDFNKYLKIVNQNDKSFDFSKEYENSKYNDSNFVVSNSTIKNGINYTKQLLKIF